MLVDIDVELHHPGAMLKPTRTNLGPHFSEGSRLLWTMVDLAGSQSAVQKTLGAKPGVLSRWLYGDLRPRVQWALRMRDALGIPIDAWHERPRRRFKPPACRAA